jgi:hypothetical protein
MSAKSSTIWVPVLAELPDAEITVLLSTDYGEVNAGYYDGTSFRFAGGDICHDVITHWAHFPPPPAT